MIVVVASVSVKPGSETEFEQVFSDLRQSVKTHESGTLLYELFRSRSQAEQEYTIVEHYADEAAWERHKSADYTRASVPRLHRFFHSARADVLEHLPLEHPG